MGTTLFFVEAVAQKYSVKNVFLKISQNSQENICAGVSFWKSRQPEGLQPYQKVIPVEVFSCEFCKILENGCFKGDLRWLHLYVWSIKKQ